MTHISAEFLIAAIERELERGRGRGKHARSGRLGPVFYRCRLGGVSQSSGWRSAQPWPRAIERIVARLERHAVAFDTLELGLAHSFRELDLTRQQRSIGPIHRGVRGLEVETRGTTKRLSPFDFVAQNLGFEQGLGLVLNRIGGPSLKREPSRVTAFDAVQFLYLRQPEERLIALHRGDRPIRARDVTRQTVAAAIDRLSDWFVANMKGDGSLPYMVDPSRLAEVPRENEVRQLMTSMCLGRLALKCGRSDVRAAALRSLKANLDRFYRDEDGRGLVEHREKIKLGGIAAAALAIFHSPERAAFQEVEKALAATMDLLWNADGSFQTFLKPSDRTSGQDYYPGEALLYLCERHAESPDPEFASRLNLSIEYYQKYHDRIVATGVAGDGDTNAGLAMIPWHTQAYARLWDCTRDDRLLSHIFKMNDRLVAKQQWSECRYRDVRGRFAAHASATGVYLEGLCDAYRVAKESGDSARAAKYHRTLVRGIRNLMQLQFRDVTNQFYIQDRAKTQGAFRTEVYDNTIRIDNNQHAGIALCKFLEGLDAWHRSVDEHKLV